MSRRRVALLAVVLAWIVSLAGGPTSLAAARPVTAPRAAPGDGDAQPIFTDGFESGDLSQWTTRSGLVVQQDEVASGGFAARATRKGGPAYARLRLDPERSELYYRIRFKVLSLDPQHPVTLVRFLAKQEESIASVFVQSLDGANRAVLGARNDAAGTVVPNGAAISTASWHELQAHLAVGGPAGRLEVWLDGTRVDALSQTASFGAKPIARLQLGEDGTAASYDIAFDDVIADVGYVPASMVPKPVSALITIETVPATPGITFALDDLVAQADQKGVAQLKVDRLQPSYRQHLKLVETEIRPGVRVSLGRWYWKDLTHARAALETSYLV
ncbi:MAG: hypothetical protein IRY97_01125, partial [Thermomicrobiaceae bacterium]|nr:hypothetical protein [Thermomicrobiaceae bacterium]